jgi:hypothetical protein
MHVLTNGIRPGVPVANVMHQLQGQAAGSGGVERHRQTGRAKPGRQQAAGTWTSEHSRQTAERRNKQQPDLLTHMAGCCCCCCSDVANFRSCQNHSASAEAMVVFSAVCTSTGRAQSPVSAGGMTELKGSCTVALALDGRQEQLKHYKQGTGMTCCSCPTRDNHLQATCRSSRLGLQGRAGQQLPAHASCVPHA